MRWPQISSSASSGSWVVFLGNYNHTDLWYANDNTPFHTSLQILMLIYKQEASKLWFKVKAYSHRWKPRPTTLSQRWGKCIQFVSSFIYLWLTVTNTGELKTEIDLRWSLTAVSLLEATVAAPGRQRPDKAHVLHCASPPHYLCMAQSLGHSPSAWPTELMPWTAWPLGQWRASNSYHQVKLHTKPHSPCLVAQRCLHWFDYVLCLPQDHWTEFNSKVATLKDLEAPSALSGWTL